jgi:CRISPR-associated protein Cmr4
MDMTLKIDGRPAGALLGLHALTALHAGTGTALGTVDLPVQRERHTHWPTVAGSALKGVLRDVCRTHLAGQDGLQAEELVGEDNKKWRPRQRADNTLTLTTLFGPPTGDSSEFAGALSITDARLLAFPVRSLRGVFAWVTCAVALERLQRDATLAGLQLPGNLPDAEDNKAVIAEHCPCLVGNDHLILEEFEFTREARYLDAAMVDWLATTLLPDGPEYTATRARFKRQLVVLSVNDFNHFAYHATEVCARVGLNYETKTVKDGALFYQEFVPAETLFYSVVLANPSRARKQEADGATLLKRLRGLLPPVLQVGGDESTGKGICGIRMSEGGRS